MTQITSGFSSSNVMHRLIRETIEQNFEKLIEKVAWSLKHEATEAYQKMDMATLREIARSAIAQTAQWMEESSGPIIEDGLKDGLAHRLELGFTIADFVSTTDIMERELKDFCHEVFADRPEVDKRSQLRLDGIYTIARSIEARMVMRFRKKD